MKLTKLLAVLFLTLSTSVLAADKRGLVLEMLEVTQAKKNHELMIDAYIKQFSNKPVMATKNFEKYFREAMSWGLLVEPMIKIYEETYTAEELKTINQFYSSPIGQSFIAKSPEVNEKSSVVIMNNIQGALKKIQAPQ